MRKRFPYRKRIKKEMIIGKKSIGDSTHFYVEGYGANQKYYFKSRPVFNADSILIQDNVTYGQYDKPRERENSQVTKQHEFKLKTGI